MKHFTLTLMMLMGLATTAALTVLADTSANGSGNQLANQLTGSQVAWYAKPAAAIQPAPGIAAKGGTLLVLKAGSSLYLEGDSTLHKYQMRANALEGSAVVKGSDDLEKALKTGQAGSMAFIVPLKDFKSRESGLDSNAYKALKADQNPEIKFGLEKETLKAGDKDGSYVMTAKGYLTVAGTTVPITLMADTAVNDGQVELKGVQKLKMSEFKITPPSISLLVTSITCTDEIEIHYDVVFAPVGEAN